MTLNLRVLTLQAVYRMQFYNHMHEVII